MLKKLRWKFILIIMVLLAAVLGTALAVQTVSAARQYREETEQVLRAVLQRGESMTAPLRPFSGGGFAQDDELYTTIPAFYASVDGAGRTVLAITYNASLDKTTLARAVEGALAAGASSGQLDELNLCFLIQPRAGRLGLAFADLGWEQSAVRRQALTAALVLGAGGLFRGEPFFVPLAGAARGGELGAAAAVRGRCLP